MSRRTLLAIALAFSSLQPLVHAGATAPVIGDFLADNGNNDNLNTDAKPNFKPYAVDLLSVGPTVNGRTTVDFISTLSFPSLL